MSGKKPRQQTTIEFPDLRTPEEETIVDSMARLVDKLLSTMAEHMRFCVFLMDHGYDMDADQTTRLAHVLADYTDKICTENQTALMRELDGIESEKPASVHLNPLSSSATEQPTAKSIVRQIGDFLSQQSRKATPPDPGHRSTILSDSPMPMAEGMVDTLWDYVRDNGFGTIRQDEVGHLFELLKYYIRVMTRADGPTPYRVRVSK